MKQIIIVNLFLLIVFFSLLINSFKIANILKLFDYPSKRKNQKQRIPLVGGILIWFLFTTFLLLNYFSNNINITFLKALIFSSFFFIIGFIDDKYKIGSSTRLLILFFGSLVLYLTLNITQIGFINLSYIGIVNIGTLSLFFSLLCILLFQNSMNMIDGLNGLSTTIFIGIILFIIFKNNSLNNEPIYFLLFLLIIFLVFNLKNKIFLGDSGIYFVSSFLSLILIEISQLQKNIQSDTIFLVMILPGVDMFRLFLIRIYNKKNPFLPDTNHIHHILKKKFSSSKVLTVLILLNFIPYTLYEFLNLNFYLCLVIFLIIYFKIIFVKK